MKTNIRLLTWLSFLLGLAPVVAWAQPTARHQTAQLLQNTDGPIVLALPLAVSAGTASSFTITNTYPLPTAAQGVLGINGVAITSLPRTITTAQASQLTFDPAPGFSGTYVFGYTATGTSATNTNGTSAGVTYGIPVGKSSCGDGNILPFLSRTVGEDWSGATGAIPSVTVEGVTVTTTFTTTGGNPAPVAVGPTATFANNNVRLSIDENVNLPGKSLTWIADYNTTNQSSTLTFALSRAVDGFTINLADIDFDNGNFADQVILTGRNGTTIVPLTASDVVVGQSGNNTFAAGSTTTNSGTLTGRNTGTSDVLSGVVVTFPSAITSLAITYQNATTGTPAPQAITIPSISWCASADVTSRISGPTTATAGSSVTYTVTTTNAGGDRARNVVPTLTLVPNLPAASLTSLPAGASYNATTGVVTFASTVIASGGSVSNAVTFTMPNSGSVTGKAANSSTTADAVAANNNGTAANANVTTVQTCQTSYLDNTNSWSGLTGEYYAGVFYNSTGYNANAITFFQRTAPVRRIDQSLNFSGNSFGAIVPPAGGSTANPDVFSARYRGSINIAVAGTYTFYLTSDDGSYMWIDGNALTNTPNVTNALIDNGGDHSSRERSNSVNLTAGLHEVLIVYAENGGDNILKWEYANTAANIARQVVPASVLCAGPAANNAPPVASNVTNTPLSYQNTATVLSPNLSGSDPDGTVAYYNIETLPSASAGVLALNGTAVVAGQSLTAAQLAQLTFAPVNNYVGNATFTYSVTDNAGRTSTPAATYTIPVVAPADVTTSLTGPASLNAGQPSGTYTVVFANNGPNTADGVTRTVTIPAGASNVVANGSTSITGSTTAGFTITYPGGSFASNSSTTYQFSFTVPTTTSSSYTVSSNTTTTSPQGNNTAADQASLSLVINPVADVVTTISGPASVAANSSVTYTALVSNNGPSAAANVAPTVQLTKGLLSVSLPDGGSYNANTGLVTLPTTASLASGATPLSYRIIFNAPNNDLPLNATVQSTSSTTDSNASNNDGTLTNEQVRTDVVIPTGTCGGTTYGGQTATRGLYTEIYTGYFADNLSYFESNTARMTRTDGNVNFTASNSWGDIAVPATGGGTTENPDYFTTRSRGYITIMTSGNYTFTLYSDDASYLWVGNAARDATLQRSRATVDHGGAHSASNKAGNAVYLAAGTYPLLLLYGEQTTNNVLTLSYSGPDTGGSSIIVPSSVLCATRFAGPLPVELKTFEVKAVKADALLTWATASEKNNDHFDVERSLNGATFEKIGLVRGQGTSQAGATYIFTDNNVAAKANGTVYYRLHQVDTDGTASYSPVRTVVFERQTTAKLSVYPNPTRGTAAVTLDLTSLPQGTYQVTVLDMTGRLLVSGEAAGGTLQPLSVQKLPQGTYLVTVRGTTTTLTQRLVKE